MRSTAFPTGERQTPQLQNMVLLFLSVGFLNGMIQQSTVMDGLQALFQPVK